MRVVVKVWEAGICIVLWEFGVAWCGLVGFVLFFFFKQKTAYEIHR